MSFGLVVNSSDWGEVDISNGWLPSKYIGSISTTVKYKGANTVSKNYAGSIPADMELFAVSSSRNGYGYYQKGGALEYACYYAINCTVSGQKVTVSSALWAGYANADVIGTKVSFEVYGYLPATTESGEYGAQFVNSGVSTMLTESMEPHVARWKVEENVGTAKTKTYITGVPTSEPKPLPFISDSGKNAVACYIDSKSGYWRVNVLRGFPNCKKNYNPSPTTGVLRIVVFTAYTGEQSDYGLSIYTDTGKIAYSSVTPPLMFQRSLSTPKPSAGSTAFSATNTDQFSAAELELEPMVMGQIYGIGRLDYSYHWELGTVVTASGEFTVGTLRKAPTFNPNGNRSGWWGPTYAGSAFRWIAGTDYFS